MHSSLYTMNTIELLKSRGLKKTTQRVHLINILREKALAVTEEEIKKEMGTLYDRITFYRTIQTLLEANLIHRITIDSKTVKYALNQPALPHKEHSHFFCNRCHSVTCLETSATLTYGLPTGFREESHELLIKGVCCKCNEAIPAGQ